MLPLLGVVNDIDFQFQIKGPPRDLQYSWWLSEPVHIPKQCMPGLLDRMPPRYSKVFSSKVVRNGNGDKAERKVPYLLL